MSLSCGSDFDPDYDQEFYWEHDCKEIVANEGIGKCWSCNKDISSGEEILEIKMSIIDSESEDESHTGNFNYLCEHCNDMRQNLEAIGYCVSYNNVQRAMQEYRDLVDFKKNKKGKSD